MVFHHFCVQLQAGPPLDEMSIPYIPRNLLHAIEYLHSEGLVWNRGPQGKTINNRATYFQRNLMLLCGLLAIVHGAI
jgi:uncharacterized membrane protein